MREIVILLFLFKKVFPWGQWYSDSFIRSKNVQCWASEFFGVNATQVFNSCSRKDSGKTFKRIKKNQNFHQSTKKQNKTKSINVCRRLQRTKTMLAISVYSYDNNNIFFSTENRFFGMVLISRFDNIMHPVTVLSLRTGST